MKKEGFNPYLPGWEYIPDGEPHVFGQRLYLFGSHDRANGDDYCLNDYVAWSAPVDDLSDWRYEGVIYRRSQHPAGGGKLPLYAPDVGQGPDGKYYLYYSAKDSSIISVAVCDTPAGAYEYLGDVCTSQGRTLGLALTDWFQFDPSILVDTDGRIWLYSGTGQKAAGKLGHPVAGCFVMELMQDMRTVKEGPKLLLEADDSLRRASFFEGASARHIGDWYYLVYPTTDMTGLNYAMSRYPDRGFVHRGMIHSSSDIGLEDRGLMRAAYPIGNSHGGLVCVGGQWYIFDHRMTNGTLFSRQGVAEPVEIRADGTIGLVESTSCGLNGGPLAGRGAYPAYIACNLKQRGIAKRYPYIAQDEPDYDPDNSKGTPPMPYVREMRHKTMVGYKYFDFENIQKLELLVRGQATGEIAVKTDEKGGIVAKIPIRTHAQCWKRIEGAFCPQNGKTALYLQFLGRGSLDLKGLKFL